LTRGSDGGSDVLTLRQGSYALRIVLADSQVILIFVPLQAVQTVFLGLLTFRRPPRSGAAG